MSHDRGCYCGREKYEYHDCPIDGCNKRVKKMSEEKLTVGKIVLPGKVSSNSDALKEAYAAKHGLMPDPRTGQGCVRGNPLNEDELPSLNVPTMWSTDPETWPLPPSPLPDMTKEQMGEGADGGGQRLNKGKLRMELTPAEWEVALADVSTKGSLKYEARNWEKGMGWASMIGCMKRHINRFLAGERYDGEEFDLDKGTTGCHHLAMVAWNALALMSYDLRGIGTNDFPKDSTMQLFLRVNAETSDMGGNIHDDL